MFVLFSCFGERTALAFSLGFFSFKFEISLSLSDVNVELVSMKIYIDVLGSPAYYVTVECGTLEHRTKVSSG